MKKILMNTAIIIAVMILGTIAQAQPPHGRPDGEKGEKIEALRIAFISGELNLSPQEAEKFWPVYNQFRAELKTLHQNFKMQDKTQLSAEQQLDMEQKKLDLKKKYKGQFETVLGKEKVNQLYNLEQKFHEKLKEMRDQRQRQNGGRQGPPPGEKF
ncbi:MAG: hypothetical protein V4615_12460 [Bacteroidota bacterium]